MAGKKDTDLIINRRIFEVRVLLLKGYKPMDIYEHIDNKLDWNKSHGQIREYIRKAKEMDKEDTLQDFEAKKQFMLDKLDLLYKTTIEAKDYANARGVLKQITEIQGLNAPKKLDVKGELNGGDIIGGLVERLASEKQDDG